MPELPEVETCRRGITPHIQQQTLTNIVIRQRALRWPIPDSITEALDQPIKSIARRAKYLLLNCDNGTLILHLGMSGSLRIVEANTALKPHDHVDFIFANGKCLRFNDPRRFGAILWTTETVSTHKLIAHLGPEPLSDQFNAVHLQQRAAGRKMPIKTLIMDNQVVVGVGNIYANESLFLAGILPQTPAGELEPERLSLLVPIIKQVLQRAIEQGGTTLKDFTQIDGKPGYFAQSLMVYGRANQACLQCQTVLREVKLGGRSTVYCPSCQQP